MSKSKKTNAMRILERNKITYKVFEYKVVEGKTDGISVADSLSQSHELVFKTLVTKAHSGNHYVFVIPVAEELDLKKAASVSGEKKIEMLAMKELLKTTGYVHGGCSPIGMKKQFKTFIDKSVLNNECIICSGGRVGMQIEVLAREMIQLIDAGIEDICK